MINFPSLELLEARPTAKSLLARLTARKIQNWIVAERFPAGVFLGREADLQVHFHVSRPTLRAAIRYLEIARQVSTKAGVRGGVFVDDLQQSPATVALARHVVTLGQPLSMFFSIYMPFFAEVACLAAVNASESQRAKIAHIATRMTKEEDSLAMFRPSRLELRTRILEATGCAAIELVGVALFMGYNRILEGELKLGKTEHEKVRAVKKAETSFIASLVSGDRDATLREFNAAADIERSITLETIKAAMLPKSSVPETLFAEIPDAKRSTKLAEHVIRAIRRDVHQNHAAGTIALGSIAELAARYGVSQEICREALGILSLHGIISIRRGRGGGVFASTPSLKNLEIVIDPELRSCGGLPVLRNLLAEIRVGFSAELCPEEDKLVTITFLDELIDRVNVACFAANGLPARQAPDTNGIWPG